MIKSFADRRTRELFEESRSRSLPPDVIARARRKLDYIDECSRVEDLRGRPGNRLHALKGDRHGQHSIAINDQWRICFRFAAGHAYDVEICDYH